MKKAWIIFFGLAVMLSLMGNAFGGDDKADVEKVIKKSYFNGAFNELDT